MRWIYVFCLLMAPCFGAEGDFEKDFRKEVGVFLEGLDAGQRKACVFDVKNPRRWKVQYTGGKRGGVQIGKLNEVQRKQLEKVMRMVVSDYGWVMANKVAKQDGAAGLGKYYVACFGDVDGDFAFRVAEHHLTLVHLEVKDGKAGEFGPILLGANPPDLWGAEERALMKVWGEVKGVDGVLVTGRGVASRGIGEDGVLFSELGAEGKKAVLSAWAGRLHLFSEPIRARILHLFEARGGWKKARVAFYNEGAVKRCKDGGRWDFKCGMDGFLWDFEGSRAHIHMSLMAVPE